MRAQRYLPLVLLALISSSLAQAGPFGSWAARGVVVKKEFRPTPLSQSLGVDGIYRLELRGSDQKVRRQMVTRGVFLAYEVGDQFNESDEAGAAKRKSPVAEEALAVSEKEPETVADNRLVTLNFPREMLRETEGF
ncbi:hypothetical protein BH20VER3_BH20VER3_24090 [soil metagenome]